jgi:hypothetical protein
MINYLFNVEKFITNDKLFVESLNGKEQIVY